MSNNSENRLAAMWQIFLMLLLAAVASLAVAFITAPKKVDSYYLSQAQRSGMAVCVWAHWTWHADEQAFCTNNYQEAVDFTTKANSALKGQQ